MEGLYLGIAVTSLNALVAMPFCKAAQLAAPHFSPFGLA